MSYTKRQLIEEAFAEIGLADYVFDLQPEQLQRALRRMDTMIKQWEAKNIFVGYPIPGSPEDSLLDEETNLLQSAEEAVITNLAVRIAPAYGKQAMPETKIIAQRAYDSLLNDTVTVIERQLPVNTPMGAGTKPHRSTGGEFSGQPDDPAYLSTDTDLLFNE
jgi:hypothetical protein